VLFSELETNNLVCDCRLKWFVMWMSTRQKGSRLRVSELAVCGIPTALKGTLLKELMMEDLHCGECCPQKFTDTVQFVLCEHLTFYRGKHSV